MPALAFSKARLTGVLDEIRRLEQGEFPYEDSKVALGILRQRFQRNLDRLGAFSPDKDPQIINDFCAETLYEIFENVPLLGFLLRSTNVRNAFEVYGPLLRLARRIITRRTKLILSSEWEFAPFTYRQITPLPDFVFIGIPASESENPLVLPLAGHEFGHTLWKKHNLDDRFSPKVEKTLLSNLRERLPELLKLDPNLAKIGDTKTNLSKNIRVKRYIAEPVAWAISQAEEFFCDAIGLWLFDQAFLHAYAYLLAPRAACPRTFEYPNTRARIANLMGAAAHFKKENSRLYTVPTRYESQFQGAEEPKDPELVLSVSLADEAAKSITPAIYAEVTKLLNHSAAPQLKKHQKARILRDYAVFVPCSKAQSLTNILNAAWDVFNSPNFWPEVADMTSKLKILRNLVLKNIELLEIEERNTD